MKLLYTSKQIHHQLQLLGQKITQDYQDKNPLLVGVLKGSVMFLSHLLPHIKTDLEIDFLTVSSYQGTDSKDLKLLTDLQTNIKNRHVIIVEDILDSGKTLQFLTTLLKDRGVASLKTATLVTRTYKPQQITSDYNAFSYPGPEFLLGFGFDLDEKHRNLPDIYTLQN